jgi:hypothetical protein
MPSANRRQKNTQLPVQKRKKVISMPPEGTEMYSMPHVELYTAFLLASAQLSEDTFNQQQPKTILGHQKVSLHRMTCDPTRDIRTHC